jgi:hypothetical protein
MTPVDSDERQYGAAAGQRLEAVMLSRVLTLSLVLFLLAGPARAAAPRPGGEVWVVPEGGLVVDGGDTEETRDAFGSCLDPSIAGETEAPLSLAASASALAPPEAQAAGRPRAIEYSDGYRIRLKVHKYASLATLPLFVAQVAVGQKLYNGNGSDGTRSLHGALAAGTGVLFGVNTVTGVWNLAEGRKDPSHRTKRMVHGILMAVADAGFLATGLMAPESEGGEGGFEGGGGTSRSTHRTVALTSMGIATVAYLMMLID